MYLPIVDCEIGHCFRPLPAELLRYAREDTHYLLYIADVLRNRLLDTAGGQSMLRSVLDRSKQICAQVTNSNTQKLPTLYYRFFF
jgi:ribonuclease D